MVVGRIEHGQIHLSQTLPEEWEGQTVRIEPFNVDDDDDREELRQKLAALDALGPMEYVPGERAIIERHLAEIDELSRTQMQRLADSQP